MATNKALNEQLRNKYLTIIQEMLTNNGEEALVTNSNEICIPTLDAESNEKFVVFTIKIPTGSRDGDEYDGYAMAEDYAMKREAKAEKAKAAAEAKAKKIAKDEKRRNKKQA